MLWEHSFPCAFLLLVVLGCCGAGAAALADESKFPELRGNPRLKFVVIVASCMLGLLMIERSPASIKNKKACEQLRALISEWHMGDKKAVIQWLENASERKLEDPSYGDESDR